MTYAVIGADNVYSWHPNNIRAKAFNNSSFGPSGKVKMVSFNNLWNTNNSTTATNNLNGAIKPDVVLYYSFGLTPNAGLATALNNYVNSGGVLIYGTADNDASGANTILNGILEKVMRNSKSRVQALRMTMFIQSIVCRTTLLLMDLSEIPRGNTGVKIIALRELLSLKNYLQIRCRSQQRIINFPNIQLILHTLRFGIMIPRTLYILAIR